MVVSAVEVVFAAVSDAEVIVDGQGAGFGVEARAGGAPVVQKCDEEFVVFRLWLFETAAIISECSVIDPYAVAIAGAAEGMLAPVSV